MTTETTGPYFAHNSPAMLDLEAHVDRVGLANVLYALAHICREKAEHLQVNWQDRTAAREWKADASLIERSATKI